MAAPSGQHAQQPAVQVDVAAALAFVAQGDTPHIETRNGKHALIVDGAPFLMLGGQESFNQGKYDNTPIGAMLPVYLDYARETKPLANLRMSLTPHGWL